MNAIKCLVFFLFVAMASGMVVEPKKCLMDPWGEARETCSKKCGMTPEQLKCGNKDMKSVAPYLICMSEELKTINEDGSMNKENIIKIFEPLNPVTIVRPIIDCCLEKVYDDRVPNPHEVGMKVAELVACYKSMVPKSMWKVTGLLEPPVYRRLNKCKNCC